MSLTVEQQNIVDAVCSSGRDEVIAVNAIAGSGKTATAGAVIQAFQPRNGFYTAYNKAIIQDSAKSFGDKVECRTIHSLAYNAIRPKLKIENLSFHSIKEDVPYPVKGDVIRILDDFYRSSELNAWNYVEKVTKEPVVQRLVCRYALKMFREEMNPTFNFLLKYLHILMSYGQIEINKDLLILDECQDTTPVTLELFKLIKAKKKLILGDKYQNIYSFMNTVNAFELLDNIKILKLTKSFRCSEQVAGIVEDFGKKYLDSDFKYTGTPQNLSIHNAAFLSRTNAGLIGRMAELVDDRAGFALTRGIDEIFSFPISLLRVADGLPVEDRSLKYLELEYFKYSQSKEFSSYSSFFGYLKNVVDDQNLNATIHLLEKLDDLGIDIYNLKNRVSRIEPNINVKLSTVHAFKGLEACTVNIENDLNVSIAGIRDRVFGAGAKTTEELRKNLNDAQKENINTYYVALSRARTKLVNYNF